MARPLSELQALLEGLDGVAKAYIQPPTDMQYPCILIEWDSETTTYADNLPYHVKNEYSLIVVDRAPDSSIPGLVLGLPYTSLTRSYPVNGLNHFVIRIFF